MRESQYQIPATGVLHEGGAEQAPNNLINQHRMEAEFFAHKTDTVAAPEVAQTARTALQEVESRLDWYRNEAVQTPVVKKDAFGSKILGLLGVEKKVLPSLDELIDKESLVGGKLFKVPARFWLHPPMSEQAATRDWYFTFVRDNQEYTLHYQADTTGVHKIYNGREYSFTDGELERFLEAAEAYEQRVVRDVYQRPPVTFIHK